MSKYQLKAEDTPAVIIESLATMLETVTSYLLETHQNELDRNHYGDGPEDCSYCEAIEGAKLEDERASAWLENERENNTPAESVQIRDDVFAALKGMLAIDYWPHGQTGQPECTDGSCPVCKAIQAAHKAVAESNAIDRIQVSPSVLDAMAALDVLCANHPDNDDSTMSYEEYDDAKPDLLDAMVDAVSAVL